MKNLPNLILFLFCGVIGFAQDHVVIERYTHSELFGSVNEVINDKNSRKWIASENGVFLLTQFENKAEQINSEPQALCLAQNKRGDIWAAYANGYLRKMNSTDKFKLSNAKAKIRDIQLIEGKLWVGTNVGMFLYNPKNQKLIKEFTAKNSKLKSNKINFIHQDVFDVVWVGTDEGVHRVKDQKIKKSLNSRENFKVIAEKNDERWLVTDQDIHITYGENRWNSMGLEEDISAGEINDIAIDRKGNLFIASDKLVKVDPINGVIESYTDDLGLLSKKCLTLAADAYNHIYIGTEVAGLFRLKFSSTAVEVLSAPIFIEKDISCNGADDAELKIIAAGGIKPYKYKWNKRWMSGNNPKGVKPGYYSVTTTDKNKVEFVAEITVNKKEPLFIQLVKSKRVTGPNKRDGSLLVKANGGKGPYSYSWNNGKNETQISRLPAKEYSVTVTDVNGCTVQNSFEVPREKFLPDLAIDKISVGQTLRINHLYFEADSSIVTEISFDVLNELYDFLNGNKSVVIEIGGHTNNIPSHEYCDNLSTNRAKNVAKYLYDKGIDQGRIAFKGYGKRAPVATNKSLAGRKKNQRVEIKILSVDG